MRHLSLDPGAIGVITDIHANPFALDAVLHDGDDQGVTDWLVLGDVVAMGPAPLAVLEQLDERSVLASISGNTERYILTGDRPAPTLDEVAADPSELPRLVSVAATFAWTKGYLTAAGRLETLSGYEAAVELGFPDGTTALAVHASLVADDGVGINPDLDLATSALLFPDVGVDLVLGGHTHRRSDVTLGGVRYVNPGSVSNHDESDHGARYAVLRVDAGDHAIEFREVAYDKALVADAIRTCGIPGDDFLFRRYFPGL